MNKALTVDEAIDDFILNVEPNLFKGERRGNKNYYRVRALIYARQAEKSGKSPQRRVTASWAKKILTEFAPERYRAETTSVFYLNDETP